MTPEQLHQVELAFFEHFPIRERIVLPDDREQAVLTAADDAYFPGAWTLASSLHRVHPGLQCYVQDLGLADWQRRRLTELGAALLPAWPLEVISPELSSVWQTFNKPFYILRCPARRVLWLDSDCIVTGSLRPLFELLRSRHLMLAHWFPGDDCRNDPEIYERLPTPIRLADAQLFNLGVGGFDKSREADARLLRAWAWCVGAAAVDARLRSLIHWGDEGALLWACEWLNLATPTLTMPCWNAFACSAATTPAEFFSGLDCVNAVNHYTGPGKYWPRWSAAPAEPALRAAESHQIS